mgnify:CR=1 FL=1|tara:strand:- start:1302 stop:1658 length:357 start_codon:yes stop_codon:yes gene_type:complete
MNTAKEIEKVISIQKPELEVLTEEEAQDLKLINAKYRSLEARYNSVIDAVRMIEGQNTIFRAEIETNYKKMEHAQENVDINKGIVMNLVLKQNETKNDFIEEIDILKGKLVKAQQALG